MRDLLILGTVYTLDPARPRADALLVRDGRIAKLGGRPDCEREAGAGARVIELGEGCAVPGLIDAHGHPILHGRSLEEVRLGGAASEAECAARVARHAQLVPDGWIRGGGWDQNLWPRPEFPDARSLDALERPVALSRVDVHALWCNSAALRAAGIDARTPDPAGGRIVRRADGSASGVLIDTAMELVLRAIPRPSADRTRALLLRSLEVLARTGVVSVHDAAVEDDVLDAYTRLAEADELPVRVYGMLVGQDDWPRVEERMRRARSVGRLTVRAVKLFADGALGSRGAAMHEPYEDDSGNKGLWLMEPRELAERIARVAEAGFQPCVHCIGDHACTVVLEAAARLPRSVRARAEHLQILRPRDLPLLARSGAIASMQPAHATSDGGWAEERLGHGTERQRGAYAFRSVLDAGAPLAFGSDFPVEEQDPRLGLAAAVTRTLAAGSVWMPEQRISREEALRAFTSGAAYAEFAETRRGTLREGFDADLTLFGSDVMTAPAESLRSLPIAGTVVGGRLEFSATDSPTAHPR